MLPISLGAQAPASVTVETFLDDRGTDADWLGAIRGGYGNVLKTLRTDRATSLVVEDAFRDALAARGLLAQDGSERFAIGGRIEKLDCSYYFNKEAHARLEVEVLRLPSRARIHAGIYTGDETSGGFGAGIFGSVEGLRQLAQRALQAAIDAALNDPALLGAINTGE